MMMLALLATSGFCLVGCDDDDDDNDDTGTDADGDDSFHGTCNTISDDGHCFVYVGSDFAGIGDLSCQSIQGTYSTGPCPTANLIGTCKDLDLGDPGSTMDQSYYTPKYSVESIPTLSTCADGPGATTWVPAQ
jgi:hypothetical protein